MPTATSTRVTPAEYLAFERVSELKHEFRDGRIVLRPGANRRHNEIASNALAMVCGAFRGRPCHAYGSSMRIKVVATGLYAYPDLSATRGEGHFEDGEEDTLLDPAALIEIHSPSTREYDRGEKFSHYRQIPSLTDFLLIDQDRLHVEQHTRGSGGQWQLREFSSLGEVVRIVSLDCDIPLRGLYDKVWAD